MAAADTESVDVVQAQITHNQSYHLERQSLKRHLSKMTVLSTAEQRASSRHQ